MTSRSSCFLCYLAGYIGATLLISCLLSFSLHAQAWPRAKGETYIKLSYGASTAANQFSFDGTAKAYADNVNDDAFFDRSLYLYSELGITPDITAIASLPYKRVIVRDATYRYRTYGFGSAQIGARVGLKSLLGLEDASPDALAASMILTLPTGYTRNYSPSTGSGQIDAETFVSYGRSFYPMPAYAQAALGYRYRSTFYGLSTAVPCQEGVDKDCIADRQPTYSDELTFAAEAGYTFGSLVFVNATARGTWSLAAPVEGFSITNPIPTRQRVIKVGGTVAIMPLPWLGISTQVFFTPFGQNTVRSTDIFLGVDVKFPLFSSDNSADGAQQQL